MNKTSRTITGIVMIVFGLVLTSIPFIFGFNEGKFVSWIYGVPILIIGFVILFNKNEDKIEEIKMKGGNKKSK